MTSWPAGSPRSLGQLHQGDEEVVDLGTRIIGRVSCETVADPVDKKKKIVKAKPEPEEPDEPEDPEPPRLPAVVLEPEPEEPEEELEDDEEEEELPDPPPDTASPGVRLDSDAIVPLTGAYSLVLFTPVSALCSAACAEYTDAWAEAGLPLDACTRQYNGDGGVFLMPADLDEPRVRLERGLHGIAAEAHLEATAERHVVRRGDDRQCNFGIRRQWLRHFALPDRRRRNRFSLRYWITGNPLLDRQFRLQIDSERAYPGTGVER